MSPKQAVSEVCRLLEQEWWDASFRSGYDGESSVSLHDTKSKATFLVAAYRGQGVTITLMLNDDDEPVSYSSLASAGTPPSFGFFAMRRIAKAVRFAAARQAQLEAVSERLEQQLGRGPTDHELCQAMGLPARTFER